MYPETRLRRLRNNAILRNSLTECNLHLHELILPLFVHEKTENHEISAMPGHARLSLSGLCYDVEKMLAGGVNKFILFGIPDAKDEIGSPAWAEDGIIQKSIRLLKQKFGKDIFLLADLCLCEYTNHGHCGVLVDNDRVDNDETLKLLVKTALSYAECGIDCIAPSGMMDGVILCLRRELDKKNYQEISLMAYSAKFSSAFYGPFREACDSAPSFGDRKSYQMNPANAREALRELQEDVAEGADIIMVKPALPYLDIIRQAADNFLVPVCAYNVSGEYSMIKAASGRGWLDEKGAALESLLSIRRAGAGLIISYWVRDILQGGWL
jgi:porphobilinogen synthase